MLTGKDDHFASMVGMCRSSTVFEYKEAAKAMASSREFKGNLYLTQGKIGERIVRKTGDVESNKKRVKDGEGITI